MATKLIVLTALRPELDPQNMPEGVQIFYTGIGKINATLTTLQAIEQAQPALIVNFGTVGAVSPHVSGLIEISRVVQRDMIAEPLAPRGRVPFCERPHEYFSEKGTHTCGTGDSFVTAKDPWLEAQGIHVVDMELYAIAAVAHAHGLPWLSYKYVTDFTNDDSGQDWHEKINHGEVLFLEKLRALQQAV
ncbi:5'-methylthioadenosine nucleosidase [Zwartia sp.]|uniref:phosphorylase family protein n=1 Tax=Zwartia sp. TaxID=2978004 RepID=UPI003BB1CBB5